MSERSDMNVIVHSNLCDEQLPAELIETVFKAVEKPPESIHEYLSRPSHSSHQCLKVNLL